MRARNELLGDTYTTMQSLLEKLYSYVCLALDGDGTRDTYLGLDIALIPL
jgi:hypothetical protein